MQKTPRKRQGKFDYALGRFLKDRRIENGWTREQASEKLELSEAQLKNLENSIPKSFEIIQNVFDFYGYELVPKRKSAAKSNKALVLIKKLLDLVEEEFSDGKNTNKKSQLVATGRIVEILKSLSKVSETREIL